MEQKLNRNLKKRKQKKNEPKFNPMPHTERTFDTFNGFDVLYNVQCSGTLRALGHIVGLTAAASVASVAAVYV